MARLDIIIANLVTVSSSSEDISQIHGDRIVETQLWHVRLHFQVICRLGDLLTFKGCLCQKIIIIA